MPDPIRSTGPATQVPAARPAAPATRPAADTAAPRMDEDAFSFNKVPSPEMLAEWRGAIADLAKLPKAPGGREAQRAWVATVTPKLEAAEKALRHLEHAEFFTKSVPTAEVEAARKKVDGLRDKVDGVKEASGLVAPTKPASPLRPLNQATTWAKDMMASGGLWPIIGALAIVPCIMVDLIDTVTRPLQAIAYPFFRGQYEIRQNRWEKEHPEVKK